MPGDARKRIAQIEANGCQSNVCMEDPEVGGPEFMPTDGPTHLWTFSVPSQVQKHSDPLQSGRSLKL